MLKLDRLFADKRLSSDKTSNETLAKNTEVFSMTDFIFYLIYRTEHLFKNSRL
ncbi:hypothetical protein appser10_10220 [Actinobacillus pleuropneumoniae serovar 10 str. D13039]|nr:hypothetical protein appser10_10220 [Actinobacillus pleuropneumoniae serovar 10 str. D13039]